MEIDLTQLSNLGKPMLIGGLSLTAIWTLLWPKFKAWFDSLPKTNADIGKTPNVSTEDSPVIEAVKKETAYSTDKAPPSGFKEHVAVIIQASLYAEPSTQLKYLLAGLTEAQVLKNEVARMGSKVPTPTPVIETIPEPVAKETV